MSSENTDSTALRATNNTSQAEIQPTPITASSLSLLPQQPEVSRWLDAGQTRANIAATQQAQRQVPKTSSFDPYFTDPYFSTPFGQSLQTRERRQQVQAVSSNKGLFPTVEDEKPPTGTSPNLQSLERFLNTPPERKIPANEYPLSINQFLQSVTDERQTSSFAEKKSQQAKQHHPSGLPVKIEASVSAAPPALPSHSGVADLERRIKLLENLVWEVAHQLTLGADKPHQRELHLKLFSLEKRLREKHQILRDLRTKYSTASASNGDGEAQLPLRALVQKVWSGGKSLPAGDRPVTTSPMAAAREAVDTYYRTHGHDDRSSAPSPKAPSASVLEAPREPAAPENPEDEWMEIELEELEPPLGQEEWEDDIAPELIPRGAADNPFYPGSMI